MDAKVPGVNRGWICLNVQVTCSLQMSTVSEANLGDNSTCDVTI